ncbi:MAG: hypothetical protein WAN83_06630, partial [Candidatus Dormiibacterota bacterium]
CVAAAFLFMVSTAFASYARFNFYYVAAAVLLFALGSRGVPLEPISRPTPRGVNAFRVAV